MTFCLGARVKEGLVAIADTRVTSGSECIEARKISTYQGERYAFFVMTSGLRSVRDKSLTYFEEVLETRDEPFDRLFKVVNAYAEQLRRVTREDRESLEAAGLSINLNALIGGQMSNDREHKLFLLYPEGNWIEVAEGTPYHIIGASGYGKPVLDRTLNFEDTMRFALKVGCLAFDSTRISAADVDFPIDVALYAAGSFRFVSQRFEKRDMAESSSWWQERLRQSVTELPSPWMNNLVERLPTPPAAAPPAG